MAFEVPRLRAGFRHVARTPNASSSNPALLTISPATPRKVQSPILRAQDALPHKSHYFCLEISSASFLIPSPCNRDHRTEPAEITAATAMIRANKRRLARIAKGSKPQDAPPYGQCKSPESCKVTRSHRANDQRCRRMKYIMAPIISRASKKRRMAKLPPVLRLIG
jgi:hypothetical protein